MESNFVATNGIKLHYLEYRGTGEPCIMMPGLTSNAYCFEGLVAAGWRDVTKMYAVDLRGRGLSTHPDFGYDLAEHANDIIGMMDALGLRKVIMGGHSFGAWLSMYLAAHYPDRVAKLVLIDAAAFIHPQMLQMLQPSMTRLGKTFSSFDAFVAQSAKAPFVTFLDPAMMPHYQADIAENEDGTVTQRGKQQTMMEAITKMIDLPWVDIVSAIKQPGILFNATGAYVHGEPLIGKEEALQTAALMENVTYKEVPGNHLTMLYRTGAADIVAETRNFLQQR